MTILHRLYCTGIWNYAFIHVQWTCLQIKSWSTKGRKPVEDAQDAIEEIKFPNTHPAKVFFERLHPQEIYNIWAPMHIAQVSVTWKTWCTIARDLRIRNSFLAMVPTKRITEALTGVSRYLFPCSPEINWLKPLFHWTATVLRQLATDIASGSQSSLETVASDS